MKKAYMLITLIILTVIYFLLNLLQLEFYYIFFFLLFWLNDYWFSNVIIVDYSYDSESIVWCYKIYLYSAIILRIGISIYMLIIYNNINHVMDILFFIIFLVYLVLFYKRYKAIIIFRRLNKLWDKGKQNKALDLLDKLKKHFKYDYYYYWYKGKFLLQDNKNIEGVKLINSSLSLIKEKREEELLGKDVYTNILAELYKDLAAGYKKLNEIKKAYKFYLLSLRYYQRIKKLGEDQINDMTNVIYSIGYLYFNDESYKKAEKYFSKVFKFNKDCKGAYYLLAYSQWQLKNYKEAIQNFKQLLECSFEGEYLVCYYLIKIYKKTEDNKNAFYLLKKSTDKKDNFFLTFLSNDYDLFDSAELKGYLNYLISRFKNKRDSIELLKTIIIITILLGERKQTEKYIDIYQKSFSKYKTVINGRLQYLLILS